MPPWVLFPDYTLANPYQTLLARALAPRWHARPGRISDALALAAPVIAVALGAKPCVAPMIAVAAGLGGLAFAFLGGAGAALALASRRGGVLIALVVLPLLTPPVIFGGALISNFADGLPWTTPLFLLAGYALACVALTPFAMAGACRNAQS